MYKVCGLRLGPNFVVRLAADKNFLFAVCGREKSLCLRFLVINIYGHTVVVTQILRLWLTEIMSE